MEMGLMAANKAFYELITLGKSFEQNVLGDQKSFTLNFIDWKNIENNSFHISEEYSVLRSYSYGSNGMQKSKLKVPC